MVFTLVDYNFKINPQIHRCVTFIENGNQVGISAQCQNYITSVAVILRPIEQTSSFSYAYCNRTEVASN